MTFDQGVKAINLCPNNIRALNIKLNNGFVEGILASGNLAGLVVISYLSEDII